jgi:hypothetical protein
MFQMFMDIVYKLLPKSLIFKHTLNLMIAADCGLLDNFWYSEFEGGWVQSIIYISWNLFKKNLHMALVKIKKKDFSDPLAINKGRTKMGVCIW